jgi:predicted Zn-dependent peptidase
MKRVIIIIVFILNITTIDAQINPDLKPTPSDAKPIKIGEFHSFTADNNLRVFLIRKRGYPKFRISIDFGVPLIPEEREPEARKILADILSKGTLKYESDTIRAITDYFASSASGTVNGVTCAGMKSQLETMMNIMVSYITSPKISEEHVREFAQKSASRVRESEKTPKKELTRNFMAVLEDSLAFYKDIPTPKIEERAEVYDTITVSSVISYFNKYINPDNSYCIISGDFTVEEANRLLTYYLKDWKNGNVYQEDYSNEYSYNFPKTRKIYVVDKPDAVQSRISVKWPLKDAFPYGDNEPLLMVMNQIYGDGYLSNLNKNIRLDKGLSYGAKNFLSNNITGGNCSSTTMVRNQETAYALENIFFEMLRMRNELVSDEVLNMAKSGLIGDFSLSMSNINSPAIIGFGMVKDKYNLPDDYLKTYPEKLKSITADDVRKAAQKYIKPYECLVFIEGKVEDIKGTLEKFGEVEYYTSDGKRIL